MSFLEDICFRVYNLGLFSFFATGFNNGLGNYNLVEYVLSATLILGTSFYVNYSEHKKYKTKFYNLILPVSVSSLISIIPYALGYFLGSYYKNLFLN